MSGPAVAQARSAARRVPLSVVAGVLVAGTVSVAYAYLSGGGTGSGNAGTGAPAAVTLAPGTTTSALYPGASASVSVVATNPNPGPVRVRSLAPDPTRGTAGISVDSGHSGCATGTFSLAGSDNGGLGWTVPGNASLTIALPNAVAAGAATVSGCQGATLTVFLVAG